MRDIKSYQRWWTTNPYQKLNEPRRNQFQIANGKCGTINREHQNATHIMQRSLCENDRESRKIKWNPFSRPICRSSQMPKNMILQGFSLYYANEKKEVILQVLEKSPKNCLNFNERYPCQSDLKESNSCASLGVLALNWMCSANWTLE